MISEAPPTSKLRATIEKFLLQKTNSTFTLEPRTPRSAIVLATMKPTGQAMKIYKTNIRVNSAQKGRNYNIYTKNLHEISMKNRILSLRSTFAEELKSKNGHAWQNFGLCGLFLNFVKGAIFNLGASQCQTF